MKLTLFLFYMRIETLIMEKFLNSTYSKILLTLLLCTFVYTGGTAQLAVTPESSAQALIDEFLGVGVVVTNVEVNCADGGIGFFDGTASNVGIDKGLILTSGQVFNAVGPNNMSGASSSNNSSGDPDLQDIVGVNTFDACVFEFDFVPVSSTLTFNYVFGSEEYLEFVDQFNDVFAFLISGPGFTGLENIALIPGTGQPVTINNVNDIDNSQYYVDNGDGINNIDPLSTIQYDGFTTALSVQVNVTPCETYHLKLAVSDASDNLLDSGVFLEANSLGSDVTFDEPIVNCNSDGTFTLEFPFNGSNDGNTYSLVESDASLGVSDVSFTDDGTVSSVTVGPYPAASSWNIEIEGGDFCGTTLDFSGSFDCCVGQSCALGSSVTSVPCDDGDDCTVNDVEIILNCDNSICTPCTGTPLTSSLVCNIVACAPDIEVACSGDIAADIAAIQFEDCGSNPTVVAGEVASGTNNSECGESEGDTYTILYTVTSDCGSISTCAQTFTVSPDDLVVTCPDDVTGLTCGDTLPDAETSLPGSSNCSASVEFTVISVVDSEFPTSFCTGNNLAVTRTYTVMDDCDNEIQCVQTFTFEADTEGPEVICPDDVTGLTCGDTLPDAETTLSGIDNCSPAVEYLVSSVVDSDLPTSFCAGDNLVVTRTYTVSDECRNQIQCVQTFTFEADTDGPQIDCPADVTGLTCGDTLPDPETSFSGTDNCGSGSETEFTVVSVVDSDLPTSFCADDNLVVTRTYTVVDDCGNETQCVQNFTYDVDNNVPQIDCPADVEGLTCGEDLPTAETTLSGTDNCGSTIEFTVINVEDSEFPSSYCTGNNLARTRTYTVEDDCGNETQCVQTFTYEVDTEAPEVSCPADVTGLRCGDTLPDPETTLSGIDNCGSATEFAVTGIVESDLPTSFCAGDNLVITRTYTVVDNCGNETECVQSFTFETDADGPQIDCPADVAGLTCGEDLPPAQTTLSGTDDCGSTIQFTVINVEDSEFPSSYCTGNNLARTRTYTVEDDCGNETQCVQTFTYEVDTEAPEVSCPADVTGLRCGDSLPEAETVLSGIDNCSPDVEYVVSSVEDSDLPTSFCAGDNLVVTRTYTVSDECRNSIQCVQTFTFEADTDGPQITCPSNATSLTCGETLPAPETTLSGTDNCGSATEFTVINIEESDIPTSFCENSNLTVTRTYTVVDDCGNEAQCVQTFTFAADAEGPQINCLPDVSGLSCGEDLPTPETTLSGTDDCGSAAELTVTNVEDSEFPSSYCTGNNLARTRTYTVVDECGNEAQCVQTFNYEADTEAPQVNCPADVTGLRCGDSLPEAETVLSGIDNCSPDVEYVVSSVVDSDMPTSFCAGDDLVVTRTYTVSDECRNQIECVQTFTFEADTDGPQIDCPDDVSGLVCGDNLPSAHTTLSGTDDCGSTTEFVVIAVEESDYPTNFCTDDHLFVTRTYTVADDCGNETQCVQTFNFASGSTPPSITCPDACLSVVCPSDIHPGTPEFTTSCGGGGTLALTGPVINGEPGANGTTYTYTHTVTDDCGETASCHQVFTVVNGCTSIDFDYDDHGNPLHPATQIFDQYEDFVVTTDHGFCPMLFDTGNPTSNDFDMGTPNEQYGGPGVGAGGDNNTAFQGNALVVSNDCHVPNEKEGQLTFTFQCAITIQTIDLLDMKCGDSKIELYNQDGNLIEVLSIPAYGVNSFNEFEVNVSGVYTMVVDLVCGGGITGFSYCKDNQPGADCGAGPVCEDYKLDFEEDGYHWADNANSGSFDVDDQTYTINIADDDGILVDTYEENGGLLVGIDPHDVHDDLVICYNLSQVSNNVLFDIVDLDYKNYHGGSQQQEAVCVYGLLGDDPTQILPSITSLEGSVEIVGNCANATIDSKESEDDESVLVEFTECIDKVVIVYGTGPDSPTQDPTYSKIIIGEKIGFNSQVCPNACLADCSNGSGSGGGDDDGDGVCNDVDVCPGGDDFADRDGDGIPDACDDICYDYHVDHSACGADWQHGDTSGKVELGAETVNISIVDNDNIFVDSEAVGTGLQVGIDPHDVHDELIVCYDLSLSSSHVVFDIVDLDYKNSASKQQEAVCVYGTLNGNPTQIFPTITSLDGSVAIDGNCAEGTSNSANSHQDESILVEFTDCIDKITIVYGTGSNSPTHDPTYSKIVIGGGIFTVEQCPCTGCGSSEPCTVDSSGDDDTDGDGVCNDIDICPGFDDNVDTDGDGIPDGCDDDSSREDQTDISIGLYPNPVYGSNSVTIEIDAKVHDDAQIVITDALGRVMDVQNIQLANTIMLYKMSTSRLASGIYFVQLQTNDWRTDAMKLVVVKP